jgi:hypothetical protein
MLLVLSIPIGCGGSATAATEPPTVEELEKQGFLLPEVPRITCYQLKQMMDAGDTMYIVDVRTVLLYDLGHLPNTLNIPSDDWREATEDEIAKLLALPRDRLIVTYCD